MVRAFEPRLFDLLAAAHLAITRGGYNTVLELRLLGVPAICIPAWRGAEDQRARIQAAAREAGRIRLGSLDPGHLVAVIRAVAGEAWWRYQLDDASDDIAVNKLMLAHQMLAVEPNMPTVWLYSQLITRRG
jgi:UDP-N-acetylglucosamine:LPS N-acetylglucosamine transferase